MRHIPNFVTFLRIFGAVPLAWFILYSWPISALWPAFLVCLLALTDWIDGALARHLNAKTSFGAWLDPLADKVIMFAIGGAIVISVKFAWWMSLPFCMMSVRDGVLSFNRASPTSAKALPVSNLGKIKTWIAMLALIGLVLPQTLGVFPFFVGMYWVAVCLSIISAWQYLRP